MENKKGKIGSTYELKLSAFALKNIDEITGYIAFIKLQPSNAIKVGDAFFNAFEKIQNNPFAYKECDVIPTKTKIYRRAICLSWIIIFKIDKNLITILGIIHHSRNPLSIKAMRKIK